MAKKLDQDAEKGQFRKSFKMSVPMAQAFSQWCDDRGLIEGRVIEALIYALIAEPDLKRDALMKRAKFAIRRLDEAGPQPEKIERLEPWKQELLALLERPVPQTTGHRPEEMKDRESK